MNVSTPTSRRKQPPAILKNYMTSTAIGLLPSHPIIGAAETLQKPATRQTRRKISGRYILSSLPKRGHMCRLSLPSIMPCAISPNTASRPYWVADRCSPIRCMFQSASTCSKFPMCSASPWLNCAGSIPISRRTLFPGIPPDNIPSCCRRNKHGAIP